MDAIRTVLEVIRGELEAYLQSQDRRSEDWVILTNLMDREGRPYKAARDRIVMSLANIAEDAQGAMRNSPAPAPNPRQAIPPRPAAIDLLVLFYANFRDEHYPLGLGAMSRTIGFFQQNPVFTRAALPALPAGIDRLAMALVTLDLADLHHLMGLMGTTYLPAACYRLRGIAIGATT